MGMFDNFYVSKNKIVPLIQDQSDILDYLNEDTSNNYFYFQTKSLDNSLINYYLEEDGKLFSEKYHPDYDSDDDWHFPVDFSLSALEKRVEDKRRERKKVFDKYTGEIEFYDYFDTEEHQVALEFKFIVIDGQLSEGRVIKLERVSLEDIRKRDKIFEEERNRVEATFEMKLFRLLQKIEWKIDRWKYPLSSRYFKFKEYLRKRAGKKANIKNLPWF